MAFVFAGALFGRVFLNKLIQRIDRTSLSNKYPESIFIFAMMVAFFYAVVASAAGLSAIIGSFLAGVSFAGVKLKHGAIFHEGAEHLQIIFASIFFVSLGVLIDVHALTGKLIMFVIVLTLVAGLTKVIGCGLPARLQGMSMKDSAVVGFGMMPRGEVAMIVALIGLSQGLIAQGTYAALVLMSLLTTIVPPLIFRNWLLKERSTPRAGSNRETANAG